MNERTTVKDHVGAAQADAARRIKEIINDLEGTEDTKHQEVMILLSWILKKMSRSQFPYGVRPYGEWPSTVEKIWLCVGSGAIGFLIAIGLMAFSRAH